MTGQPIILDFRTREVIYPNDKAYAQRLAELIALIARQRLVDGTAG